MVTFPKGNGPKIDDPAGGWSAMYFNECMNGFEYQAAGHMIWEGMLEEGLAISRAIHDRYHASKRNPWNEVECGDHYARSMASYGVFLAACGYEHHGPHGYLAFHPRIRPDKFRAAFTTAEGWGTFAQQQSKEIFSAEINVRWGRLRLTTLRLSPDPRNEPRSITVLLNQRPVPNSTSRWNAESRTIELHFPEELTIQPGAEFSVAVE
jgi:hypothetical protein